ncbi:MAG: NAD(P)/FAD-dependent oxidoreductase [Methanomassiliicoccales archaeon]|jgi:thioredoxin reductase (NADPH)
MAEIRPVIIIGAGPAGISAAIFLLRAGLEPLLLEEDVPGGLLRRAGVVENYPGFPNGIAGTNLADRFFEHFQILGGSVTRASVDRLSRCEDGTYAVSTDVGDHRSMAVIVATGTKAKIIAVEGLQAAEGHRVFYDLYDLLAKVRLGEKIVVYGGGDAAFDLGLNLSQRGHEVVILCRSRARCLPLLRERACRDRIQVVEGWTIARVMDGMRLSLELEGMGTIEADRLLIACGREPRLDILDPSLAALSVSSGRTSVADIPGLYLAGDVVAGGRRQVGIAIGSGLNAAMLAEQYLRKM